MTPAATEGLLARLPPEVDPHIIRDQLDALAPPYEVEDWVIPLPVWATRPFDDDPASAWDALADDLCSAPLGRPLCVYIHVPFCSSKCGFCDCYSFALQSNVRPTMERYVAALTSEIERWAAQGTLGRRPVSTVHLGGGTPTFLTPDLLARLADVCRRSLGITADTEFALESTVEGLRRSMMDTMNDLGIRRVHVGVQTLDDEVRSLIGRRRPAREALQRIEDALEMGWVVSVDLICGLPQQSVAGFLSDIETLVGVGVDGFSLYELLIYPQNRGWAERHGLTERSHLPNYVEFVAGAQVLERHGFRKNTFNHWANDRDGNVYFTSPARDEDCLAVGTIADGVFGDYHYRHPRYAPYMRGIRDGSVGLEGGLRRTIDESRMQPLVTALMSGRLAADVVGRLDDVAQGGSTLVDQWLDRRLVEHNGSGGLTLTASGSWFVGNMAKALTGRYPELTLQA